MQILHAAAPPASPPSFRHSRHSSKDNRHSAGASPSRSRTPLCHHQPLCYASGSTAFSGMKRQHGYR